MGERLTESERDRLFEVASIDFDSSGPQWAAVLDAVEAILTARLAARGAGDGLAGRVAALAAKWDAEPYPKTADAGWNNGWNMRCEQDTDALRALLDPDAQGADEGGGS